jgi:hypothetical protein
MAVTTILVETDNAKIQEWTDYITRYDRETCKTAADDLSGLGTPQVASGETLEEVLNIMGKAAKGGVALIYAHANADGLIMRITANANSAQSHFIRGISRAWRAIDEIIKLRSGKWPAPGKPGKPEFLIDLPAAKALFKTLKDELAELPGGFASRLTDPAAVGNRDQADAWFDNWMELMGKACLAPGLGETDLRRVCRAMQKVRDAKFKRVEVRACNIGKKKENLDALKEFFGVDVVAAPKVTMFFGKAAVNLNPSGNLDQLARQLGGFRGTQFTAPSVAGHQLNRMPGGEAAMATGRRNRIFPSQAPGDAILQATQTHPFKFSTRMFSTTAAAMTRFVQANYRAGGTFQAAANSLPVGGMWTADDPQAQLPFLLPLEPTYRNFLEVSN